MTLQTHMNSIRGGCRHLLGLVIVLALVAPITGIAKKCPYEGHPSCGGDSGGDGEGQLTPRDTRAWWSGDISSAARDCPVAAFGTGQGYIRNECVKNESNPETVIRIAANDLTGSGKDKQLCGMLSDGDGLVLGDGDSLSNGLAYSSSTEWNDDICLDEGSGSTTCTIRARINSYGYKCHSSELVGGECPGERMIIVEAFGEAKAATAPELNPFTQSQAIAINHLTFTIKAIGKNRTEATCTIDFSGSTAVTFHSDPQ